MKKHLKWGFFLFIFFAFLVTGCSDPVQPKEEIKNEQTEDEKPDAEEKNDADEETDAEEKTDEKEETEEFSLESEITFTNVYSESESKYCVKLTVSVELNTFSDYEILRSDSEEGTYVSVGKIESWSPSLTDKTVEAGKTYWYKVSAKNKSNSKIYTTENAFEWKHFNFKIYTENDLSFTSTFSTVTISWDADPEADSYTVLVNKYSSYKADYVVFEEKTTDTSFTVKNLLPDSYYYAVFPHKGNFSGTRITDCLVYNSHRYEVEISDIYATDTTVTYTIQDHLSEDDMLIIDSVKYSLYGSKVNSGTTPFYSETRLFASSQTNVIEYDYVNDAIDLGYYKSIWMTAKVEITYKNGDGKTVTTTGKDAKSFNKKLPAPKNLTVTAGRNSIIAAFTPACRAIEEYQITYSKEKGDVFYIASVYDANGNFVKESEPSKLSQIKVTGLENETEYSVKVTPGISIFGKGDYATSEYRNYTEAVKATTGKAMAAPEFIKAEIDTTGKLILESTTVGDEGENVTYGFEYRVLRSEKPKAYDFSNKTTSYTQYLNGGNRYIIKLYAYTEDKNDKTYSEEKILTVPKKDTTGITKGLRFAADEDVIDLISPDTWENKETPRSTDRKFNFGYINLLGEGSTLSGEVTQKTESTKEYIVRFGLTDEMLDSEKPIRIIIADATSTIGENMGLLNGVKHALASFDGSQTFVKPGVLNDDGTFTSFIADGPSKCGFEINSTYMYNNSIYLQIAVSPAGENGNLGFSYYY